MRKTKTKFDRNKHKLINTWNVSNDKVTVVFEDGSGNRFRETMVPDWYFGILEEQYKEAKELVKSRKLQQVLRTEKDTKFPGFVKVFVPPEVMECANGKNPRVLNRYQVVQLFDKNGIKTYEGDLAPNRRWYVDIEAEIAPAKSFSKLYFDIETDDSGGKIAIGKERIVSFGAVDNTGKKYFGKLKAMTDEAEEDFLKSCLKIICNYDMIIGWNSREFDIPYLKERMKKYELDRSDYYKARGEEYLWKWKEIAKADLLKRFRHAYRFDSNLRSFSLDYISNHFLGHGKIKHEKQRIIDLWHNDQKLLKEYNLEDCKLVKELDDKQGTSDMMILQSSWCGVPPSDFGLYSIIDAFILRTAHKAGMMERSSMTAISEKVKYGKNMGEYEDLKKTEDPSEADAEKKKYLGGLVLTPETGFYEHVYVFDFKSLYPSMMKTSNIGPDTLMYEDDGKCIINPGTQELLRKTGEIKETYFKKEHGTIYLAISDLMTKRKEYKKKKFDMIEKHTNHGPEWDQAVSDEIVVKEIANSTYGIMGLEYGRYFDVDVAESITLFGQWMILNAKKFFESQGFKVIYGDTDSVFVATKDKMDVHAVLDKYHTGLTVELKEQYRMDEHFIELEFDKEYDGFILIAKKTYCGHTINHEGKDVDSIYARGIEFQKRGTFGYGAAKQKEIVDVIMKGLPSTAKVKKWLIATKKDFYDREFTRQELAISNKVGKNLSDYDKPRKNAEKVKVVADGQTNLFGEEVGTRIVLEASEKKPTLPLHVRIAKQIKEKTGEFYKNTEVEYIVTSHDKKIDGVHIDDFDGTWCKEYYWENKTLPLLKRIISVTHPKIDFETLYNKLVEESGEVEANTLFK